MINIEHTFDFGRVIMCEICEGMTPEQAHRKMLRTIDRYGWAMQYVESSVDERGVHPAFCYTVGLTEIGCPEVIVTGRAADESVAVLGDLAIGCGTAIGSGRGSGSRSAGSRCA